MKAIVLNASPRKNCNTAQLLKAAQQGAEQAGAETEYIDLYDLNFTGCRSCLACKRKDGERCKCFRQTGQTVDVYSCKTSDARGPGHVGPCGGTVRGCLFYTGDFTVSGFFPTPRR